MEIGLFRKGLILGIIIFLICPCIVPSSAGVNKEQKSIQPISNGNTLYVGGSGEGNYTKIQDAIDNANDGDTVFVYDDSSPYYENIIINKSISLIGEDRFSTIIDGFGADKIISIKTSNISITNITIYSMIGQEEWHQAIHIYNITNQINNILISGCIITNCNRGVHFINVSNIFIIDCFIHNNTAQSVWGLRNSDNITINSCTIDNNGKIKTDGWYTSGGMWIGDDRFNSSQNIKIFNCQIFNNIGDGINIFHCKKVEIFNNTIFGNYDGILFGGNNSNLILHHNNIYNQEMDGIFVDWGFNKDCYIKENIIFNNGLNYKLTSGIYIGGNGIIVKNNNISHNRNGIYFITAENTKIIENNFFGNKYDAWFINLIFNANNIWLNNYWNRARLFPKIIPGSIFFQKNPQSKLIFIPWFNIDWRPAKQPYDI